MLKIMRKFNTFEKYVKEIMFILSLAMVVLLSGCGSAKDIMVKTEYKDVYVPIRCEVSLPQKPVYNKNSPSSAAEMANYYLLVEETLKGCIGVKDE